MQAIRVNQWGGPNVLRWETVPELSAPGAGEVLIAVRAAGVNPVDTYIRSGTYAKLPDLPTRRARMRQALWKPWGRAWKTLRLVMRFLPEEP